MNDTAQIIVALSGLITSIATLIAVLLGGRKSNKKIDAVHAATNSKMDQLLSLKEKSAFSAGEKSQRDKQL